jgi:hypothetical protein
MAGTLTPEFGTLIPSQKQQILDSNYLKFNDGTGNDFAQQFLPEIYEQEVERYGNRTLSGFLRMVGAEMPMTSDQVIWSEQNRLHISYDTVASNLATASHLDLTTVNGTTVVNVISINDTIVIMDTSAAGAKAGTEAKGIVTDVPVANGGTLGNNQHIAVQLYGGSDVQTVFASSLTLKIFVYGSDYTKGTTIGTGAGNSATRVSVTPQLTQFSNSPVIIRNQYVVSGSDTAQIGWVEVATEDGTSGYLWYLKAESETRLRFEDYLEMALVEGERNTNAGAGDYQTDKLPGTQGLFAAIEERGNKMVGFTAAAGLADFDNILKNLDTQGAIEENMLFLQRQTSLDFDDMLAAISAGAAGGTAYGLFENSEEMALNLGFSGFRRGSYDFYKTDWKYLNDASTRGGFDGVSSVEGVLIPAGTSTVYDQILGSNIRRPFLHVRYRASQSDDRRMKSWLTGSVGGAFTSTLDAMEVNFLSERCLVTQAANNFVIFKGA